MYPDVIAIHDQLPVLSALYFVLRFCASDRLILFHQKGDVRSSKYKVQSSNPIILTFEIEKPQLTIIRTVFITLTLRVEPNAPAGCDYLRAHLVFDRRAQRSVRKIGGFNRFFANLIFADANSSRQIAARPKHDVLFSR